MSNEIASSDVSNVIVNSPAPLVNIKKLHEKAILIELSVSRFNGTKKDKKASSELTKDKGAEKNSAGVVKTLIQGEKMSAVINAEAKIREIFRKNTSPWDREGTGVLPIGNFISVKMKIEEAKREFYSAVNDLVNDYENLVKEEPARLGSLFNAADYPTKEGFKSRFSVNIVPKPIEKTDFRSNILDDEDIQEINNQIEERLKSNIRTTQIEQLKRVYEKVNHLCERLKVDGKFHDSAINNVIEAIDEAKSIAIENDPAIDNLFNEITGVLSAFDAATIRDNKKIKDVSKRATEEMLNDISNTMSMFGYGQE